MFRVGQNHTFIGIYSVYIVFLAGELPYIRSYTVCICVYMVLANPNRVQTYHWSIVIKLQTSLSPVFCVQTSYHRTADLITSLLCSNLLSPHSQPYYRSFVFRLPITAQPTLLPVFCVQTSYHRTANLITGLLCSNLLSPHSQPYHRSFVFKPPITAQPTLLLVFCVQTSYHRTVNLITSLLCSNLLSPHSQPYYQSIVFKLITGLSCSKSSPVYCVQAYHWSIMFKIITSLLRSNPSLITAQKYPFWAQRVIIHAGSSFL